MGEMPHTLAYLSYKTAGRVSPAVALPGVLAPPTTASSPL